VYYGGIQVFDINKREEELKQKIEEVKRRFPFHSVQPYLVQELEELEEELSELRKQKEIDNSLS